MKVTQSELILRVAQRTGIEAASVKQVFIGMFDEVMFALQKGDYVVFPGVGEFRLQKFAPALRYIPATGERRVFEERATPRFRISRAFKENVNRGWVMRRKRSAPEMVGTFAGALAQIDTDSVAMGGADDE